MPGWKAAAGLVERGAAAAACMAAAWQQQQHAWPLHGSSSSTHGSSCGMQGRCKRSGGTRLGRVCQQAGARLGAALLAGPGVAAEQVQRGAKAHGRVAAEQVQRRGKGSGTQWESWACLRRTSSLGGCRRRHVAHAEGVVQALAVHAGTQISCPCSLTNEMHTPRVEAPLKLNRSTCMFHALPSWQHSHTLCVSNLA